MPKIRPATDADDLVAIWREVYQADYAALLPAGVSLPFEPRGEAYVKEVDGTAVAFSFVDEDWLDEVWVGKRFQGHGIGTALVRHAEAVMQARGIVCGRLSVLRTNVRAAALYRRLGWIDSHAFQDRRSGVWNLMLSKDFRTAPPSMLS